MQHDEPPNANPKYAQGPSTPRAIRLNDQLWQDFGAAAQARGLKPTAALRWLLENFIQKHTAGATPPDVR